MADRRKKDKLDRFRRELLESSDLDDATIDALIKMGFDEIHTLRHLPQSHVMGIEGLTLAQKLILIGEIENKWMSGGNSRSKRASSSCSASLCQDKDGDNDEPMFGLEEHQVPTKKRKIIESEKKNDSKKSQDVPKNESHCEITTIRINNQAAFELLMSAVNSYHLKKFERMTKSLDKAEILHNTCKIRLAFATKISCACSQVLDFSNNIPETGGIEVVYNKTYANLDILANDHAKIATYMGESGSTVLCNLVDFLFTQEDIRPYTEEWDHLMEKAGAVVKYFQSLSKAGQCVTKCYVLLFFAVLHNFMATRNRLRLKEHYKILPFVFACIPFCESDLIGSDAWVKTIFEVYEIAVLSTSYSLAADKFHTLIGF